MLGHRALHANPVARASSQGAKPAASIRWQTTTSSARERHARSAPAPARDFRPFKHKELAFVANFKIGERSVESGGTILSEGERSEHLFTVLSGWGFRYKVLKDGRRQILNYVMPGDMVGLQGTLMGEMQHSIEALSPVTLSTGSTRILPMTSPGSPPARSASWTKTC